jgi:hypothetical protein
MMDAATRSHTDADAWDANDRVLRGLMSAHPDDPSVRLYFAAHLHTKLVVKASHFRDATQADLAALDAEIERLVLGAVGFAQERPEYAVVAAKLLYFVDQKYLPLALELADSAVRGHNTVFASMATMGQLRAFTGDPEGGVRLLKQALALATPNSNMYKYAIVLLCQALQVAGQHDELAAHCELAGKMGNDLRVRLELLFGDPAQASFRLKGMLLVMGRRRAGGFLRWYAHTAIRHFARQDHREAAFRSPLLHCIRRFGPSVVPPEAAALVPGLPGWAGRNIPRG